MGRGYRSGRRKQTRQEKRLIYAFYEGESEKQYLKLLKENYSDFAVIKISPKAELFEDAVQRFKKSLSYVNDIEVIDEIWFFFDAGDIDGTSKDWKSILPHMDTLHHLRRSPKIRVRLLMTTGCLEYWLMFHFRKYRPAVQTKEQRDRVVRDLRSTCQNEFGMDYEKGNADILGRIYEAGLDNAIEYGAFYLRELESRGKLPPLTCPQEPNRNELNARYKCLLSLEETFTTVQEAITFLRSLSPAVT